MYIRAKNPHFIFKAGICKFKKKGKKVDESDLLISEPYPHCLINTPEDEKPNSFHNLVLKKTRL